MQLHRHKDLHCNVKERNICVFKYQYASVLYCTTINITAAKYGHCVAVCICISICHHNMVTMQLRAINQMSAPPPLRGLFHFQSRFV